MTARIIVPTLFCIAAVFFAAAVPCAAPLDANGKRGIMRAVPSQGALPRFIHEQVHLAAREFRA